MEASAMAQAFEKRKNLHCEVDWQGDKEARLKSVLRGEGRTGWYVEVLVGRFQLEGFRSGQWFTSSYQIQAFWFCWGQGHETLIPDVIERQNSLCLL